MNKPKPANKPAASSNRKKMDTAILVAIIGGIATLVTALITSIMAPIVVDLVTRRPDPTATVQTVAVQMEQTPAVPTGTSPQPTPTEAFPILDIRIDLPANQCPSVSFPPNVDPSQDPSQAGQAAADALNSGEVNTWPIVENAYLDMTITSLVADTRWVKLSNSIEIAVTAGPPNFSDQLQALLVSWGCGGGGEIRQFSDTLLSTDFATYSQESTTSEFDFFTLQPGEFEVFTFPFKCTAPGIYTLTFQVPYTFGDRSDVLTYHYERPILCPKSYTAWAIEEATFVFSDKYQWDGQEYRLVP